MNTALPDLAGAVQADLRRRAKTIKAGWPEGEIPDAGAALRAHPDLATDKVVQLDLAYEEYRRRRDAGEKIDRNAFCARFPTCRSALWEMLCWDAFFSKTGDERGLALFLQPGEHLGDYTLVRELGRGGFAQVFLARESSTGNRPVVVKLSRNGEQEARTLGPLVHPGVVPILSCRQDEKLGATIVCMPFLGTATLEDVLDRVHGSAAPRHAVQILEAARALSRPDDPPVPAADPDPVLLHGSFAAGVLHLGVRLAEALAFLHERQLCHRDLKPSNVLLGPDGCPRLLDFNLAAERDTRAALGGTVAYAAPEHIRALLAPRSSPPPDERADLFSLGVMLHELLTGRHPFGRPAPDLTKEEMAQVLLARQKAGCPLPQTRGLNRAAARLISRCLALDPAARPTAVELADGLRKALGAGRPRLWAARHRRALWALACLLPLAFGAAVAGFWNDPRPEEAELRSAAEAGIRAYNAHRYAEAAEEFAQAIAANPKDFRSRLYRGFALLRQSRGVSGSAEDNLIRPAALELEQVHKHDSSPLARAGLAYCFTTQMWHTQALDLTHEDAKTAATTVLLNNRACNFLQKGQLEEAGRALAAIHPRDQQLPAVCYNRAFLAWKRRSLSGKPAIGNPILASVPEQVRVGANVLRDIDKVLNSPRKAGEPGPDATCFATAARLYALAAEDSAQDTLRQERKAKAIQYLRRAIDLGLMLPDPRADKEFWPYLHERSDFQELQKIKPPAGATPSLAFRLLNPAPDRLP